jgi:hypothetical protein
MEIVRARPEETDLLIALFRDYDFALRERRWFDWKHAENPFGTPHVYKLIQDGELAGTVGLLPQPFRYAGRRLTAVQAVDGLMGRPIRGKGLFNEVMAFVLEHDPDGVEPPVFRTGFASLIGSMKALEHAGWTKLAHFNVRKAVLRTAALRGGAARNLAATLLTPVWPLFRRRLTRGAGELQVRRVDRFTEDMDRFQPADRVHGVRSAVFLNWRVIDNPRDDLRAFTFHAGDETLGYAVCKVLGDTWEVLELRSLPADPRCAAALLRHLHRVEGAAAADFWLLDGHLQPERLPQGLLDRGRSGAMFVQGHRAAGLPADPTGWASSFLDSDW